MSSGCCGRCCGLACGDCETHLTPDCTCQGMGVTTTGPDGARVDGEPSFVCVSDLCPYCGSLPCESPYLHNFRRYPLQQTTHFLIGIVLGVCLSSGLIGPIAFAFGLIALIVSRQISEFVKLDDDVQIDLAVYIAGVLSGGAGVGLAAIVKPNWFRVALPTSSPKLPLVTI